MDKQTNPKPLDEEKKITDSESSENLNQKAEIDTMEAETEVVEEVKETETLSTSEETPQPEQDNAQSIEELDQLEKEYSEKEFEDMAKL